MSEVLLTEAEAYDAMFCWLENYYRETKFEAVGIVLGELQLIGPQEAVDSASWPVWHECVERVLARRGTSGRGDG